MIKEAPIYVKQKFIGTENKGKVPKCFTIRLTQYLFNKTFELTPILQSKFDSGFRKNYRHFAFGKQAVVLKNTFASQRYL
jgi:hypothetical protein